MKNDKKTEKRERGRPKGRDFMVYKGIRLNQKQADNWDVYRVKAFLENKDKLSSTIELLKFYNDFFKENLDYLLKDSKISEFILSHEEFDKAEEIIKKCQV